MPNPTYTEIACEENLKGESAENEGNYKEAVDHYNAAIASVGKQGEPPALHAIRANYNLGCLYQKGEIAFPEAINFFKNAQQQITALRTFLTNHPNSKNKKLYTIYINRYSKLIAEEIKRCEKFEDDKNEKTQILSDAKQGLEALEAKLKTLSPVELVISSSLEHKKRMEEDFSHQRILLEDIRFSHFNHSLEATLSQVLASYALANAQILATNPSELLQKAKKGYAILEKILAVIGSLPIKNNPVGIIGAGISLFAEISFQRWEQKDGELLAKKADIVSNYFSSFEKISAFTRVCPQLSLR